MSTEPAAAPAPVPAAEMDLMRTRARPIWPLDTYKTAYELDVPRLVDRLEWTERELERLRQVSDKLEILCRGAEKGFRVQFDRAERAEREIERLRQEVEAEKDEGGGWPTYQELESLCRDLRNTLANLLEGNLHPVNDRAGIVAVLAKVDDALQGDHTNG